MMDTEATCATSSRSRGRGPGKPYAKGTVAGLCSVRVLIRRALDHKIGAVLGLVLGALEILELIGGCTESVVLMHVGVSINQRSSSEEGRNAVHEDPAGGPVVF